MGARTRADLMHDRFGVDVAVNLDPITALIGTSSTNLLKNSPNRLAFTVINLGTGKVYLHPQSPASATSGIVLAAGGGSVTLVWDEDYDAVGMEWSAVADIVATPILTLEVVAR
jgi:hypothetical protein